MDKVLAGDIDGAMAQTEALAPGTLEAHPSLLFRLHCQTFLELVREFANSAWSLAAVKTLLHMAAQRFPLGAYSLHTQLEPTATPSSVCASADARCRALQAEAAEQLADSVMAWHLCTFEYEDV